MRAHALVTHLDDTCPVELGSVLCRSLSGFWLDPGSSEARGTVMPTELRVLTAAELQPWRLPATTIEPCCVTDPSLKVTVGEGDTPSKRQQSQRMRGAGVGGCQWWVPGIRTTIFLATIFHSLNDSHLFGGISDTPGNELNLLQRLFHGFLGDGSTINLRLQRRRQEEPRTSWLMRGAASTGPLFQALGSSRPGCPEGPAGLRTEALQEAESGEQQPV